MERSEANRSAKLVLNKELKARKRVCFENLCQAVNTTPWMMSWPERRARQHPQNAPQKIEETLLPRYDTKSRIYVPFGQTEVAPIAKDELIAIAKSLELNKASIPTVAIKTAIEDSPDMFRMAI